MFGDDPLTTGVVDNEGVEDVFSVTFTGYSAANLGGTQTGAVTFNLAGLFELRSIPQLRGTRSNL